MSPTNYSTNIPVASASERLPGREGTAPPGDPPPPVASTLAALLPCRPTQLARIRHEARQDASSAVPIAPNILVILEEAQIATSAAALRHESRLFPPCIERLIVRQMIDSASISAPGFTASDDRRRGEESPDRDHSAIPAFVPPSSLSFTGHKRPRRLLDRDTDDRHDAVSPPSPLSHHGKAETPDGKHHGASRNYYEDLGLDRSCSAEDIRKAYMTIARSSHPDKNNGTIAQSTFAAAAEAYGVLSNPEKRKTYDAGGEQGLRYMGCGSGDQQMRPSRVAEQAFEILEKANGSFLHLDGCKHRNLLPAAPEPLSLEDLAFGSSKRFMLNTKNGDPEVLQVDIQPGWADLTRITFPGKGGTCVSSPSIPRDLVFVVQQMPHKQFTRHDNDLHATVNVPVVVGMCGGRVALPCLGSRPEIVLVIKPGMDLTSPLTIPRQGMPSCDGSAPGDLVIRFNIVLPHDLSEEKISKLRDILADP